MLDVEGLCGLSSITSPLNEAVVGVKWLVYCKVTRRTLKMSPLELSSTASDNGSR